MQWVGTCSYLFHVATAVVNRPNTIGIGKNCCWRCCDRRCPCGRQTGSAFIELCCICGNKERRGPLNDEQHQSAKKGQEMDQTHNGKIAKPEMAAMSGAMSKADREALVKLVRRAERAHKTLAEQRKAEQLADFERQ